MVESQNFYAQRIAKEMRTKVHFEKVCHLHQQAKMASTFASGFNSQHSALSNNSKSDILRNRAFANHTTVTSVTKQRPKPLYYFNSSNGLQASDPNTLRDMGATRNAEYYIADAMDQARNVTWKDLVRGDEELDNIARSELRRSAKYSSSPGNQPWVVKRDSDRQSQTFQDQKVSM